MYPFYPYFQNLIDIRDITIFFALEANELGQKTKPKDLKPYRAAAQGRFSRLTKLARTSPPGAAHYCRTPSLVELLATHAATTCSHRVPKVNIWCIVGVKQ